MITMLLGGLWHGAHWNFVIWGGLHGAMLCVEKIFNLNSVSRYRIINHIHWLKTMLFVMVTWVFFRAQSFEQAAYILDKMFSFTHGTDWYFTPLLLMLPAIMIAHFIGKNLIRNKEYPLFSLQSFLGQFVLFFLLIGIFLFKPTHHNPFIYFQF